MADPKTIEVSRVTVGLVQLGGILAALWAFDARIEGRFRPLEESQALTNYRLGKIEEGLARDLTISDFLGWCDAMETANPALKVVKLRK